MSMQYSASGKVEPGGRAEIRAQHSRIEFDGSAGSGEVLPGPAHLLAAALCACMLKNVERMAGMLKFSYTGASIEVKAVREEPPPRITTLHYVLRVETPEPEKRIGLLHRNILKHGTITNTLAAACELSGEVIGVREDGTEVRPSTE